MKAVKRDARLAKNRQEFLDLVGSGADWFVRSQQDVYKLRETEGSVLSKLPEPDFVAFANSLTFKDGGVVTGTYKPLMASLTLSQIFEVFESFGMIREYFSNTTECKCVAGGCTEDFYYFCSPLCGGIECGPGSNA